MWDFLVNLYQDFNAWWDSEVLVHFPEPWIVIVILFSWGALHSISISLVHIAEYLLRIHYTLSDIETEIHRKPSSYWEDSDA